ncbi:hypothetical protein NIES2104_31940 [Leptolyngbya sp. NIES-2104]|nr:hypothetical protein NIES2104_31940 [Leptolyngbya sp. NIES-2104]
MLIFILFPIFLGSFICGKQTFNFGGVLPPVLQSVFVADWDTNESRYSFCDQAAMTLEVQSLRSDHNFAPDTAI